MVPARNFSTSVVRTLGRQWSHFSTMSTPCYLISLFFTISFIFSEPVETRPCEPSPCGPNSQCRSINNQAVCSCLAGYIGSPPTCRPECITSSECSLTQACINWKCVDPCPGTCGLYAKCQVVNHSPICTCPPRTTGDPFSRCSPIGNFLLENSLIFFLFLSSNVLRVQIK